MKDAAPGAVTWPLRVLRPRRGLLPALAAALAVAAVSWALGFIWFAEGIPREVADTDTRTDAIVVLTGGAGRLSEGVDLLAAGRAEMLFISGVHRGIDVAHLLRLVRREGSSLECCMALGHSADDTQGNARETAAWMRRQGYDSLRLVTSNYHMRRSLLEFRRAMPDVLIIPNPVFPPRVKAKSWWHWPGTAQLLASEYTKYLIALIRPW